MKKIIRENPIKKVARRMLREGELEQAESSLACKDQVDRLQDMVEELGKMSNEELPKLVDKIRGSYGDEQANAYQQTANSILTDLLGAVKEKKASLEQAVLVLSGDASAEGAPKTDLNLPDEESEEMSSEKPVDFEPEMGAEPKKAPAPLGREARLPAEESRKFNKKLAEAKIIALKRALDSTDKIKFPSKARAIAEELRRVAIKAIKEEAKMKNVEKSSKKMMKPVKENKEKCELCGKKMTSGEFHHCTKKGKKNKK